VHNKDNQIAIYLWVTVLFTLISFCTDPAMAVQRDRKIGVRENSHPCVHGSNTTFAGISYPPAEMQTNTRISNTVVYAFVFVFCSMAVSMIYFLAKYKFFSEALN
jgi:hypothetical protein